ncbi:DUF695 domain-containing protein [Chryseobacterium sp. MYb264]|uniref:DUF695 domain-containing protein n=1 Tax=Chryseobacterium sp. MYb264 TaxID=2745153 RepID=UPI002E0F83EA|nr:DUF695 domain-containing protein [Chryseobacterium sp. MYb264]
MGSEEKHIKTYQDFWDWFLANERKFHDVIRSGTEIEENFFDCIAPKLHQINTGYYFLAGMADDLTAELIITVEGEVKNIIFAEEIIKEAPQIKGWKFTALKPELGIENVNIELEGLKFTGDTIFFYSNDFEEYPDEIDITLVYENFKEEIKDPVTTGICIFLDHFLGELNFATQIDTFNIIGKENAKKDLIPITKLKDFLKWREREFTEKYKNEKISSGDEEFSILEAELMNGLPLIAAINTSLLKYDSKASYPWVSVLKIHYEGDDNSGLPEIEDYKKLSEIEDRIVAELKREDGHLYIGRESADNIRESYFVSKDFRQPSKVLHRVIQDNSSYKISLDIYKDKYWQSFERYTVN